MMTIERDGNDWLLKVRFTDFLTALRVAYRVLNR